MSKGRLWSCLLADAFRLFDDPSCHKIVAAAHRRCQDLALRTSCRPTHVVPRTISLNIRGAKPAPAPQPPAARNPEPAPHQPLHHPPQNLTRDTQRHQTLRPPPPGDASPAPASTQPSKTFTLGRAKTDTAAGAQEVAAVADQEMLEGLFGDIQEHLNTVFIGHADAGASTMANLLYLCGMIDKCMIEKYEREAKPSYDSRRRHLP
ncbi:hypothetical protein BC826DRAFT_1108332 [Russula brevipes]|nr:hypothetical protein BC826DRAFT_1108332 [Russula brevipes]